MNEKCYRCESKNLICKYDSEPHPEIEGYMVCGDCDEFFDVIFY